MKTINKKFAIIDRRLHAILALIAEDTEAEEEIEGGEGPVAGAEEGLAVEVIDVIKGAGRRDLREQVMEKVIAVAMEEKHARTGRSNLIKFVAAIDLFNVRSHH